MTAVGTAFDSDTLQDNASRYADMALTANLAATALRIKLESPQQRLADRYETALRKMTETVNTVVELAERDRLDALSDHSLGGLVGNLDGPQLVARLATVQDDDSDSHRVLKKLIELREQIAGQATSPDRDTTAQLIELFKGISRRAMIQAQQAQDKLEGNELFVGSRSPL